MRLLLKGEGLTDVLGPDGNENPCGFPDLLLAMNPGSVALNVRFFTNKAEPFRKI